jgi:hypothetical protein
LSELPPLLAQPVHLPPIVEQQFEKPSEAKMLEISYNPTDTSILSISFAIQNDKIWIMYPDKPWDSIIIGEYQIKDIADLIRARLPGIQIASDYPGYSSGILEDIKPTELVKNRIVIKARKHATSILADGGVVFALNDVPDEKDSGLFNNAGIQLDFIGLLVKNQHWYFRGRLGFRSNETLPTEIQVQSDLFESFLTTAKQVIISCQVDWIGKQRATPQPSFMLEANIAWSQTWNRDLSFLLPDSGAAASDSFWVAFLEGFLSEVIPEYTVLAGPILRFNTGNTNRFYIGMAVGMRITQTRSVTSFDDSYRIFSLFPEWDTRLYWKWRLMFGLRFGEAFDLRADILGRLNLSSSESSSETPFFRVTLSKDFTLLKN